ncbi:MAG TPA: hypothetical protein VMY18_09475 [Acidobacteriota bacterium]|nr:hypothetical protein [Acidobacteriota bacterium]
MAIRLVHQPGGIVGMAGYLAGVGKAKQRQQEDAKTMWQEQNRYGNRYRQAMGGQRRRAIGGQQAQEQQGTWVDPLDTAPGTMDEGDAFEDKLLIKSQQRANDRWRRMGKQTKFPGADPYFKPAPTKRELELGDDSLRRERETKDAADKLTLGEAQGVFEGLMEDFEEIGSGGADSWADKTRMAEYDRVKGVLDIARKDQSKGKRLDPIQYYNNSIAELEGFMSGHKGTHITPWGARPGNRETNAEGEIWEKSRDPNKPDTFIDFADEPGMTDERIRNNESKRFKYIGGTMHQKVRGAQGSKWEAIKSTEEPKSDEPSFREHQQDIKAWREANKKGEILGSVEDAEAALAKYNEARRGAKATPGAPTPDPAADFAAKKDALPVAWSKTPEGMVPIDGHGRGPVATIGGTDPQVYVMADGQQVTAPQDQPAEQAPQDPGDWADKQAAQRDAAGLAAAAKGGGQKKVPPAGTMSPSGKYMSDGEKWVVQ